MKLEAIVDVEIVVRLKMVANVVTVVVLLRTGGGGGGSRHGTLRGIVQLGRDVGVGSPGGGRRSPFPPPSSCLLVYDIQI